MLVNEYVTKSTQLSHYAPHEVDTDEKKQDYFWNGLNDGLAYALEAQDLENFQGMVNKALVVENHRGVMEHKRKLVHQYQPGSSSRPRVATSSAGPVFRPAQPKLPSARQGFSTPQRQVIQHPIMSRPLLLEIRVFRGPKLLWTCCRLNGGVLLVERSVILLIDVQTHAHMSTR
jgi:hypothetical protein